MPKDSDVVSRANRLMQTMTILDQLSPSIPVYAQVDEEASVRTHYLVLDREVWEDFGRPAKITVTVDPVDMLNEEETDA